MLFKAKGRVRSGKRASTLKPVPGVNSKAAGALVGLGYARGI